ncbi:MAG: ATP-grasp domain-containing protein [Nanoarchaeota archaeon]
MRVTIIYALVETISKGRSDEIIANQDVMNTVNNVGEILKQLNFEVLKIKFDKYLYRNLRKENPDIVFNLCDSFEDSSKTEATIPAILEMLNLPYTGCGMLPLSICLNKARTKEILSYNKIPNASFQLFKNGNETLRQDMTFPLIVKPNSEDASIGIRRGCVVNNKKDLQKRIREIIDSYKQEALVEEYLDGREFDVCIIGNENQFVLPISETVYKGFSDDEIKICDYESKWLKSDKHYDGISSDFPAKISKKEEALIKAYASKTYLLTGCEGYARIEFRMKNNIPHILEVNPNPDICPDGLFFKLAKTQGWDEKDLIMKLLNFGLQRHKKNMQK